MTERTGLAWNGNWDRNGEVLHDCIHEPDPEFEEHRHPCQCEINHDHTADEYDDMVTADLEENDD